MAFDLMGYISWKMGRNFGAWHIRDGQRSAKCGNPIPPQATVNFAMRVPEEILNRELCATCRKLELAERIP